MIRHAHFYWGNTTLPWFQYLSIHSFIQHHPEWRVTFWRPSDRTPYDSGADYTGALLGLVEPRTIDVEQLTGASLQGYDSANAWCQVARSDAARHWMLHVYGGFWSDMDVLYFRSIEGSSIDAGDVSLVWEGGYVHTAVISAQPRAEALRILLDRQRAISPAFQPPGGQSPFGPGLWTETFLSPEKCPGLSSANPAEFLHPPHAGSVAYHARGARVPWGSMTLDNYEAKLQEIPNTDEAVAILAAIRRVTDR